MEIKELREKTDEELRKLLVEFREKMRNLRFKIASKQLKNVREMYATKKTIARILTVIRERKK
jgi:large subunit ribosomal protein L29